MDRIVIVGSSCSGKKTLARDLAARLKCPHKEALYGGNREQFKRSFLSRDSILLWVLHRYGVRKREYRRIFDGEGYAGLEKLEFKHPSEVARYLESLIVSMNALRYRLR